MCWKIYQHYLSVFVILLSGFSCSSSPPKRFQEVEDNKKKTEQELQLEEYEAPFDVTREYRPGDWEYDFYEY